LHKDIESDFRLQKKFVRKTMVRSSYDGLALHHNVALLMNMGTRHPEPVEGHSLLSHRHPDLPVRRRRIEVYPFDCKYITIFNFTFLILHLFSSVKITSLPTTEGHPAPNIRPSSTSTPMTGTNY